MNIELLVQMLEIESKSWGHRKVMFKAGQTVFSVKQITWIKDNEYVIIDLKEEDKNELHK